jgi:putative transposase
MSNLLFFLEKGLSTAGHVGTNVSGDIDLYLGEETPPSKSGRGKRKTKERSLESPPSTFAQRVADK